MAKKKLSGKKGSLYEEEALLDSIAKKVDFSNRHRSKIQGIPNNDNTLEMVNPSSSDRFLMDLYDDLAKIQSLLSTLLRLHEREKARLLHAMFGNFLDKLQSNMNSLFAVQNLPSEKASNIGKFRNNVRHDLTRKFGRILHLIYPFFS